MLSNPATAQPDPHRQSLPTSLDDRRKSSISSTSSSPSTPSLPSPSIVAARAYFLEHAAPSEGLAAAMKMSKSLFKVHSVPRGSLILDASDSLTRQLESFNFEGEGKNLESVDEKNGLQLATRPSGVDNNSMLVADHGVNADLTSGRRSSSITPRAAEILNNVPFEFTHNHLREWGYAYLGNAATADVFVNAVGLRRPSMEDANPDSAPPASKLVTIRARVLPRSSERKPFLIKREFDIEALRAVIPIPTEYSTFPQPMRRRSRSRHNSHSKQTESQQRRKSSHELYRKTNAVFKPLPTGAIPIHISYALHFLPILGSLMLSGHIHKTDTIDLPMPHPEAWRAVVKYIYTGNADALTPAARENVRYLAGNVA